MVSGCSSVGARQGTSAGIQVRTASAGSCTCRSHLCGTSCLVGGISWTASLDHRISSGTFGLWGLTLGTNVCLYPNGAKPMMTEPDLVTIGDGACVDSAVLVAHLNTNGKFSMERLSVGKNCVLRTWSRLQQGARLHDDTVLLEHTLVMPGESVVSGSVLQGWPPDLEASHMSLHVTV